MKIKKGLSSCQAMSMQASEKQICSEFLGDTFNGGRPVVPRPGKSMEVEDGNVGDRWHGIGPAHVGSGMRAHGQSRLDNVEHVVDVAWCDANAGNLGLQRRYRRRRSKQDYQTEDKHTSTDDQRMITH